MVDAELVCQPNVFHDDCCRAVGQSVNQIYADRLERQASQEIDSLGRLLSLMPAANRGQHAIIERLDPEIDLEVRELDNQPRFLSVDRGRKSFKDDFLETGAIETLKEE